MEERFFAATIDSQIRAIDLHEADNVADALLLLEKELFRLSQEKYSYAKIIHGIGSGNLAQAVHREIEKHPLIRDWQETEEGGSCLVLF